MARCQKFINVALIEAFSDLELFDPCPRKNTLDGTQQSKMIAYASFAHGDPSMLSACAASLRAFTCLSSMPLSSLISSSLPPEKSASTCEEHSPHQDQCCRTRCEDAIASADDAQSETEGLKRKRTSAFIVGSLSFITFSPHRSSLLPTRGSSTWAQRQINQFQAQNEG